MVVGGLAAVAVLATTAAFTLPGGGDETSPTAARAGFTAQAPQAAAAPSAGSSRGTDAVSRSAAAARAALESAPLTQSAAGGATSAPALAVEASMFVVEAGELRTGPGPSFDADGEVAEGAKIDTTGATDGDWSEVLSDDKPRWVLTSALSADEPGLSSAACPDGSGVESGLRPSTVAVHRAVCEQFPQVTSYGGMRSDGMHGQGQALDIMISGSTGDEIADWVRANASELGVTEVIWQQRIWTTQRSSEGWRGMSDRGSATANHMDHVHVTTG
ncbi:MAG: SH3 domain-containing protein [Nocardioidaceae bacterium]|nr:SH3 domain-containing protein [Nocardioidaceae bacterium]